MGKENKIKTEFSDDEFEKLPDEGKFFGAKDAPVSEQSKPPEIKDLASFISALKHGPQGGWVNAIKEEATKPLDPDAKAMVDSSKFIGAMAVPQELAQAYVYPAARAIPGAAKAAMHAIPHILENPLVKYGAGAVGIGAVLRRLEGHGE